MKIWHKALIAPLVAVIGLAALGFGTYRLASMQASLLATVAEEKAAQSQLQQHRLTLVRKHAEAQRLVAGAAKLDPGQRDADLAQINSSIGRLALALASDPIAAASDEARAAVADLAKKLEAYQTNFEAAAKLAATDAEKGTEAMIGANNLQLEADDLLQILIGAALAQGRDREESAQAALTQQLWIAGIVSVAAIVAVIVLSLLMVRGIVMPLRGATASAHAIAEGDLERAIPTGRADEIGALLRAFQAMSERLRAFQAEQARLAAAHAAGDVDRQMDAAALPGAYAAMARDTNEIIARHVATQFELARVFGQYAAGEFDAEMSRLPGKQAELTEAADRMRASMQAFGVEVRRLVAAATAGEFATRGDVSKYEGGFRARVVALNSLMEACERGVHDSVRIFNAVARGDLTPRVEGDRSGMFADVQRDANASLEQLGELIASIRGTAEAIAAASREIRQGNADLSSRTEQQAASLEQTAAAMSELTGTVRGNADSARQANQLVSTAAEIATRGGATVSEVVATMGRIADASKRVRDIITVIDGIAFQTNILALNAAVEAARAGEQGRGFAVVATEVRNLAQRSAAAAKEIKTLITENVETVDSGAALVAAAGRQMDEIVGAVKRVTDIMAEISAASAEQSSGIEQVNRTVTQMDQMTQQNAALVEEAAAAAQSLEDQARALVTAVHAFRLDAARAGTQPLARAA